MEPDDDVLLMRHIRFSLALLRHTMSAQIWFSLVCGKGQ